jgi:hypothetical protein
VWQLDFSEYETTADGIWRLAGVCDYNAKDEYGLISNGASPQPDESGGCAGRVGCGKAPVGGI